MNPTNINLNDFKEKISSKVHVIDFFAEWCGPCNIFAPIFEEVANEFSDINFMKIDSDASPELCQEFNVMSLPTIVIFKDGNEVFRHTGILNKEKFTEVLNKL
jgi:thioredoxin 1